MIGLLIFYCLTRLRGPRPRLLADTLSVSVLAFFALSAGCSNNEVTDRLVDIPERRAPKAAKQTEAVHSVATEPGISSSPAASSLGSDPATATPESVCLAFIQRMQNGDRIGAENLLTRAALTTTHRANLKLEPITSLNAETSILSARLTNQTNQMAEVNCLVTETIDGSKATFSVTWQVTKQSSGWRICGMFVTMEGSDRPRLLSFESIDDVATIKMLAARDATVEPAFNTQVQALRQAEANEPDTSLQ